MLLQQIAQSRGVGAALYFGQGRKLYLADALAGYVEAFADLFEGLGLAAGEAEARLEDDPLAFGEAAEGLSHAGFEEGGFGGGRGVSLDSSSAMKSPSSEEWSSPTGVSREMERLETRLMRTISSASTSMMEATSSSVGSRLSSAPRPRWTL